MNEQKAYELYTKAHKQIANLKSGEEFTVSDLFYGYEWKRIPRNIKASLGSLFYLAAVKDSRIVPLEEKSTKNQQRYLVK